MGYLGLVALSIATAWASVIKLGPATPSGLGLGGVFSMQKSQQVLATVYNSGPACRRIRSSQSLPMAPGVQPTCHSSI